MAIDITQYYLGVTQGYYQNKPVYGLSLQNTIPIAESYYPGVIQGYYQNKPVYGIGCVDFFADYSVGVIQGYYQNKPVYAARGCKCAPSSTGICVTWIDGCTFTNISGVTVVLKDADGNVIDTCTGDGLGNCCTVYTDTPGTYSVTATVSGYCSLTVSNLIIRTCGAVSHFFEFLYPDHRIVNFRAHLCCAPICPPTSAFPVTVTVVGGGHTYTCTITDSSGCNLDMVMACALADVFDYTVTYSSPGFVDVVTSLTSGWQDGRHPQCLSTTLFLPAAFLQRPPGNFCFPPDNFMCSMPVTLTVVLTDTLPPPAGCVGIYAGTYTLTLSPPSDCQSLYVSGVITLPDGIHTISIFLTDPDAAFSCAFGNWIADIYLGSPIGTFVLTLSSIAGSLACPMVFTMRGGFDGSPNCATLTVSE